MAVRNVKLYLLKKPRPQDDGGWHARLREAWEENIIKFGDIVPKPFRPKVLEAPSVNDLDSWLQVFKDYEREGGDRFHRLACAVVGHAYGLTADAIRGRLRSIVPKPV
jgi:hypothetical protein